jgi:hypothetical protein
MFDSLELLICNESHCLFFSLTRSLGQTRSKVVTFKQRLKTVPPEPAFEMGGQTVFSGKSFLAPPFECPWNKRPTYEFIFSVMEFFVSFLLL